MRTGLLLTLAATVLAAQSTPAPVVPRKAPEFVINMVDGAQRLLSSLRGKTVVLAFLLTTCTHCQATAGVLAKVQEEYATKGVQVVGVTFDHGAQDRVRDFIDQLGLNFLCGYSTQNQVLEFLQIPISEPYFLPALVFIDRTGTVRSEYVGDETFLAKQEINIRAEIERMLHGGAPAAKASPRL
jgi:peroxiredoxin